MSVGADHPRLSLLTAVWAFSLFFASFYFLLYATAGPVWPLIIACSVGFAATVAAFILRKRAPLGVLGILALGSLGLAVALSQIL